MSTVLLKTCLFGGSAFAMTDVDNPGAGVLAVALRRADGWAVSTPGGRLVGEKLPQNKATRLLTRTALAAIAARSTRLLAGGAR